MPKYQRVLDVIRQSHFLDPDGLNLPQFKSAIAAALQAAQDKGGDGPVYGESWLALMRDKTARAAHMPASAATDLERHLQDMPAELHGSVKANHRYMVKNVIPTPSLAYLSSYVAAAVYQGNAVTAEDAGHAVLVEVKLARMYAAMAGYNAERAAGIFTFSGTGTNMYAFRMGAMKACNDLYLNGSQGNLVVVGSKSAHYSHELVVSWMGLGRNNYLTARSLPDQSTDLADLEAVCRRAIEGGKRIACIVGVGGTTMSMGMDDYAAIAAMRDRLVSDYSLNYVPHVHADSVIGWVYLHFMSYDFDANPLGFSAEVVAQLRRVMAKVATLAHADSFSIDFHKTGYTPYNSSMIIARDRNTLLNLGRDSQMMTPIFHDDTAYAPGKFTLETSRSSANMVATWMSVSAFGMEGFQALLGHLQDVAIQTKRYVAEHTGPEYLLVNPDALGTDIYVRVYPPGTNDAAAAFAREADDPDWRKQVSDYNGELYAYMAQNCQFGQDAVAIGKTLAAYYTPAGVPVVALRIFIVNPYIDHTVARDVVDILMRAKAAFDTQPLESVQAA